jgi:hypothetical protein
MLRPAIYKHLSNTVIFTFVKIYVTDLEILTYTRRLDHEIDLVQRNA